MGLVEVTVPKQYKFAYSTDFDRTETPISEGGAWIRRGTGWTNIITTGGRAIGTQGNTGSFDDSYAHLTGDWGPDQEVRATVSKLSTSGIMEVELHVRMTDTTNSCSSYEVNFAHDGDYVDFIRWPGPLGQDIEDFIFLVPSGTYGVPGGIQNGDEVMLRIVGNTLSAYRNGNLIGSVTDTTGPQGGAVLTSGAPAIGFFRDGGSAMTNYGFTKFSARTL